VGGGKLQKLAGGRVTKVSGKVAKCPDGEGKKFRNGATTQSREDNQELHGLCVGGEGQPSSAVCRTHANLGGSARAFLGRKDEKENKARRVGREAVEFWRTEGLIAITLGGCL